MNNYFQDIEYHTIKHLSESKERILIAVAWFTNTNISKKLIELKNVDIDVVLDDNGINRKSKAVQDLINNSIKVLFIPDLKENYLMHNKFCVIDNNTVLTGSYNWTKNANTNDENLAVITDKNIAISYNLEFSKIKNKTEKIERVSFSNEEVEPLINYIENQLIHLLKDKRDTLEKGMLYEWTDINIKNKIREISESIHNTVRGKVGFIGIYEDLISKYGVMFNSIATEQEKANSRHKYSKKDLDKVEYYLNISFQQLKIKAIERIILKYQELLKSKSSNEELIKIMNMIRFILNEKSLIHLDLRK